MPQNSVCKILVADDSPVVSRVLSNILRGGGYSVVTAADGIEAVQAVYGERPDLVILDIFMPRMNGYQACRLLKHDPDVAHIPIVINTASDHRGAEFWSLHTGADAFMLKGATPAELLAQVDRMVSTRAAQHLMTAPTIPNPETILTNLCTLVDSELYGTTVKAMEWKTIFENLCEGILQLDTRGRVSSANRFLCSMLGVVEAEIVGLPVREALGEPAGGVTRELFENAQDKNQEQARDLEITGTSGRKTPVAIHVTPVHDYLGEMVGCVCLVSDITRRKQIEALNQLKNDLTDMIVHDLRTPLTSVLTGMQTVALLGDMNEDQTELIGISIEGGQILLGMINDLLDISKMEDGSLRLERKPLDVEELIKRAARQIDSLARAKGLTLQCEIAPGLAPLVGDDDKLLRMLVNLLSNAVKFTPDGGVLTMGAHTVAHAERWGAREEIMLWVRDTGEGIPADAFVHIFEKFGQVETRASGRKMSTGLGLTFCKMVAEAHGGRIWVDSAIGQGSTFFVSIPVDSSADDPIGATEMTAKTAL